MKDKPDQREGQERRDGGCGDSGDGDEDGSSTDSDESPVVWLERSKRVNARKRSQNPPVPRAVAFFSMEINPFMETYRNDNSHMCLSTTKHSCDNGIADKTLTTGSEDREFESNLHKTKWQEKLF